MTKDAERMAHYRQHLADYDEKGYREYLRKARLRQRAKTARKRAERLRQLADNPKALATYLRKANQGALSWLKTPHRPRRDALQRR